MNSNNETACSIIHFKLYDCMFTTQQLIDIPRHALSMDECLMAYTMTSKIPRGNGHGTLLMISYPYVVVRTVSSICI